MRASTRRLAAVLAVGALVASLAGCGAAEPAATLTGSEPALSGSITVFAAASLNAAFTELAGTFEAANPDARVVLNFAGSSDLVTQLVEGAPADVFASADTKNMTKLTDASLVAGTPVTFATNTLTIAVPPGNPAEVTSFADLARPGVKTVVCAAQVPCGAATVTLERATGVTLKPVSEESSVTDVLGKVESAEADAGLVYRTDVIGAGDKVEGIDFPESSEAVNTYPIAAVAASRNASVAAAFVDYVTGAVGKKTLHSAGFGTP